MAASMQSLPRSNLSYLTRINRLLSSRNKLKVQSRACSQSSTGQKHFKNDDIDISQVVIPKKIHREPTDILRALSATVEKDMTGPDYSFTDDPYFAVFEHHNKRKHAEAIVAGRRAARYIIDNYPTGFVKYRQYPERHLPTCAPNQLEYKFKNPCEEALKERIQLRKVTDAIEVYDVLRSTDDEVSLDTKLDLLDLLCTYNCKKPPVDAIHLEKLFSKFYENVLKQPVWSDRNNTAETLFKELPKKPARAYNTLLQGRAEYGDTKGAQKLYDKMMTSKIPVDVESYNKLIQSYRKETKTMEPIEKLLIKMESNGVKPTVKTFEAVLSVLSLTKSDHNVAMKVFNEMKKLNIEPNLGCFRYLLYFVYPPQSPAYNQRDQGTKNYNDPKLLHEVLDYLNDNYVVHEDNMESFFLSGSFFLKIIPIISRNTRDVELSDKVIKFYEKNPNFMSDRGGLLLTQYFQFLIDQGDIHKVMKEYNRHVPYTTVLKTEYNALLSLIELTGEYHYFLHVWTALSIIDCYRFQVEIEMLVSQIAKQQYSDDLQNKFCETADTLVTKREKSLLAVNTKFRFNMSADMASQLIKIFLDGNQLDNAWKVFVDLSTKRKDFQGMAKVRPLKKLTSTCLNQGLVDKAMEVITFMSEEEMPISEKLIASIQEIDKNTPV